MKYELEMFELYNEALKDLFDEKGNIQLRASKEKKEKVVMDGISKLSFSTFEEFRKIVEEGRK